MRIGNINNCRVSYKGATDSPKKDKVNIKPWIGATLGVGIATLGLNKLKNNPNSVLHKTASVLKLNESNKKTMFDVVEIVTTASVADVTSVLANSKGKTKEQKKAKWKEAGFQIMNMLFPMIGVTTALKACESNKALNKVPVKIVASTIGIAAGAMTATKLTNLDKKEDEPERKYSLSDMVGNFDDIMATIKIGFSELEKYVPVSKLLPFAYIFCGAKAGAKGDNEV